MERKISFTQTVKNNRESKAQIPAEDKKQLDRAVEQAFKMMERMQQQQQQYQHQQSSTQSLTFTQGANTLSSTPTPRITPSSGANLPRRYTRTPVKARPVLIRNKEIEVDGVIIPYRQVIPIGAKTQRQRMLDTFKKNAPLDYKVSYGK